MVRIFAPVFSVLVLSSAVLAVPTMGRHSDPYSYDSDPYNRDPHNKDPHNRDPHNRDPYVYKPAPEPAMGEPSSSSTSMVHATSTSVAYEATTTSTAMAHEASTTSSKIQDTTSTSTAAASSPTYGSGYANWGTDLNSCVQMCQAKFGVPFAAPPAPSPPSTSTSSAPSTGATHTVIVAPAKGVLRYVPFAVNASVGDTVRFMWGAGPHTVTKSSALTVCNKSADASSFASGQQNASFVFDQVVNNTEPTFFFCGVPNHCQKGMFGIINPPSAPAGAATSVGAMMSTWTSQNPGIAKMRKAVDAITVKTPAYNWGSNLDISSIPTEAQQSLVENLFYTRVFYAMNTGAADGASRPDGQPLSIPPDVNTLLSDSGTTPGASNGAPAAGSSSSTPSTAPATVSSTPKTNGANSVVASSALIAVVAAFSSLFLI